MLVGVARRELIGHVEGEPGKRGVKMQLLISDACLPCYILFW